MDNVDPVFASILDWDSFSIRIAEVQCHLYESEVIYSGSLEPSYTACQLAIYRCCLPSQLLMATDFYPLAITSHIGRAVTQLHAKLQI
jgi:hypothetical protein